MDRQTPARLRPISFHENGARRVTTRRRRGGDSMKRRDAMSLAVLTAGLAMLPGCSTIDNIARILATLRKLKFKIGGIRDFRLLGIKLFGKSALTDFSLDEGVQLFQGFGRKKFPIEMTLDILAINPNDGTGGSTKTISTLTSLESRLLIDGKPTVYGEIDKPVEIPGTGETSTIPIRWALDLYEFFGDRGYDSLIGTALDLGGKKQNVSRVALDAQPRVTTPYGEILYPGRITIISDEFR